MVKKPLRVFTRGLTKDTEQISNKQVDNDDEVTVPAYKGRKVATITAGAKYACKKHLIALANRTLGKDVRDMNVKKIWIWDTGW